MLRERRIKALPVVNCSFRIAGTVALADVVRAAGLNVHDGLDDKRHQFTRFTGNVYSGKPVVVGQTMTRNVRVCWHVVPLGGATGAVW